MFGWAVDESEPGVAERNKMVPDRLAGHALVDPDRRNQSAGAPARGDGDDSDACALSRGQEFQIVAKRWRKDDSRGPLTLDNRSQQPRRIVAIRIDRTRDEVIAERRTGAQ